MSLVERLSGGDPRSLGHVEEVIDAVLATPVRLDELFGCLSHEDPVVRMRAADGLEKVARRRPELLEPHLEALLTEIAAIEQSSLQWHLAQIVAEVPLTRGQRRRAIAILKRNLQHSHDWIVLNHTMEALALLARDDPPLQAWLASVVRRHLADERKAVAKRAGKLLKGLEQA